MGDIGSARLARNLRLARALHDPGYGRELGQGLEPMVEETSRVGLPMPCTCGRRRRFPSVPADLLSGRDLDRLPPGSERFVEYLSRTGRVTTMQAVELLAASRPTVLRHLRALAEAGMLEHVGTSPKDPCDFWRLARGSRP